MWTDELVKKWWFRMAEIFGDSWFTKYGNQPTNLWQQSVTEWSLERAAAVIEHYRTCGKSHPPNMSEVVCLARSLRITTDVPQLEHQAAAVDPAKVSALSESAAKPSARRRSKLLPGESYGEYQAALFASKLFQKEFDARRLYANGWRSGDESKYQHHARMSGLRLSDGKWLIDRLAQLDDPEATAERIAIQEESSAGTA